jgi:hypothetical protein
MFYNRDIMTKLQQSLIDRLYPLLAGEKAIYRQMMDYLLSLGYWPQKLKKKGFCLYFVCGGKKIAKLGIYNEGIEFGFRFHGCKSVPEWCINALLAEEGLPLEDGGGWYALSSKKCDIADCSTCGGIKYGYTAVDGREIYRCASRPIPFNDIDAVNIEEFKSIADEQHNFLQNI